MLTGKKFITLTKTVVGIATVLCVTALNSCAFSELRTTDTTIQNTVSSANFTADMSIVAGMGYNLGEIDGDYTERQADFGYSVHTEMDGQKAYMKFSGELAGFVINSDSYCELQDDNNFIMYSSYGTGKYYKYTMPLSENILNFLCDFTEFTSLLDDEDIETFENNDGTENGNTVTINCGIDGGKISPALEGINLPAYISYDKTTKIPVALDINLGESLPEIQSVFIGDAYTSAEFNKFDLHVAYSNINETSVTIPATVINESEEAEFINFRAYGIDPDTILTEEDDSHLREYIGMLGIDNIDNWEFNKDFLFSGIDWEAWGIDPDNFYESSHLKDYMEILGVDEWFS